MQADRSVFVIGKNGLGLMPTSPRKARLLIKAHKAEIVRKNPFTIRLLYKTGCAVQKTSLGIDTGSQHIGVAVVSEDCALLKAEWELRSTMEKRKLLEKRKELRRNRRYRKTPYRHPKFRHRTKRTYVEEKIRRHGHMTHWKKETTSFASSRPKGWLPPSVQSKVDHHARIIRRYMEALPPCTSLTLELARFDLQKIQDPDIEGVGYQLGRLYWFEDVKAYVLARQNYKCPLCGRKFGSVRQDDGTTVKARMHHIAYRSKGATDNPDSYLCVCDQCHSAAAHAEGGALDQLRKKARIGRGPRDITMMNIVSSRLKKAFPDAAITWGHITAADRKLLKLDKTHANDAVAIAKHRDIVDRQDLSIQDAPYATLYKQMRKKKRSLYEGIPRKGIKTPNRTAKRNRKNTKHVGVVCLLDKIKFHRGVGIVTGFGHSACRALRPDGTYLGSDEKHTKPFLPVSQIRVLCRHNNWVPARIT